MAKLARRAVFQGAVRMRLVVVVERDGQVLQRRSGVGLGHPRNVIALHRFDEALGYPIALQTSRGCRDRPQARRRSGIRNRLSTSARCFCPPRPCHRADASMGRDELGVRAAARGDA